MTVASVKTLSKDLTLAQPLYAALRRLALKLEKDALCEKCPLCDGTVNYVVASAKRALNKTVKQIKVMERQGKIHRASEKRESWKTKDSWVETNDNGKKTF